MGEEASIYDVIAFAIVNLGVQLPYSKLLELTACDPLYKALVDAWQQKERRIDQRNALVCLVTAKCAGAEHAKLQDFMPTTPQTQEEMEAELKSSLIAYDVMQRNRDLQSS
jgi:hypothetical protein